LDKSQIIVVFVSNNSVNKRGYVQREMRLALEKAEEKLIDDIYVVPVVLDEDAPYPEQLKGFQYVKAEDENCFEKLLDAITHQLERLGESIEKAQQDAEIYWNFQKHYEFRGGIPGYEIELRLIKFGSDKYENMSDVGDLIKGDLIKRAMSFHSQIISPTPDFFDFGQDRYRRTHTLDGECGEPKIVGRVLSVSCGIHTYFAGAAHPNHHFVSYVFLLDPLFLIEEIQQLFQKENEALEIIRTEARRQLLEVSGNEDPDYKLDEEWVNKGTENWEDFQSFGFTETGLEITFDPYHVAAYAFGPQYIQVKYDLIGKYLKKEFRSALDLYGFDVD